MMSPAHVAHYAQSDASYRMQLLFVSFFYQSFFFCLQLYIQESVTLGNKMSGELATSSESPIPQITWSPVSATGMVHTYVVQVILFLLLAKIRTERIIPFYRVFLH
jgi:hypothetical protein